ncbi:MAG: EF-Tu/IF-2/RF-3 family GTPase [Planctomycetota bacterium]|nr:EF-Tu/IF-2/RF-3 family GTPase [Planctomycetota bacterium]
MAEELVGTVTHYFGKAHVAGIELTEGELHVGDTIHIKGHTSDFTQTVDSMQIDRDPVDSAKVGDEIGIKVAEHAREHDQVYRVLSG